MLKSTTLNGKYIQLVPLNASHKQGILDTIRDGELWNLFVTLVPQPNQVDDFLHQAHQEHNQGTGLAFATIDKQTDRVVGSTRFMKYESNHKRIEIGYTFIAQSMQKSYVNTEAKLLMLTYAFEQLNLNRVELLTDYFNTKSKNAIRRLGAKQEGVIRNHMVMPNGRVRDSVLFSILKNEWPGVKQNLQDKLTQAIHKNEPKPML